MAKELIFEQQSITFTFSEEFGYVYQTTPAPFMLTVGETYIIVWEGQEYTRTAWAFDSFAPGTVGLGNQALVGGEADPDNLPIAIGYIAQTDGVAFITSAGEGSYNVGLYHVAEDEILYSVSSKTLKSLGDGIRNKTGTTEKLIFPDGIINAIPEQTATSIDLDFASNDTMTITPDTGKSFSSVTVNKPETLTAENIAQDVEIAGIIGTHVGGITEGSAVTIDADFSAGDQVVEAEEGTLMQTVTVTKPENLTPENIVRGVDVAGVIGIATGDGSGGINGDAIIAGSITSIEDSYADNVRNYVFYDNNNLVSANFPVAKSIGFSAFYGCDNLTTINAPLAETIGSSAFCYCNKLINMSFPNVKSIYTRAFQNCISLTSVNFPSATSLGECAFMNCSKLKTAIFPELLTISSNAFAYCQSLTTISFPKLQSIQNHAFGNCGGFSSAYFPEVLTVGSYAFNMHSDALQYIDLPKATYIGSSAFKNCQGLTSVNIPLVETLCQSAFYDCFNLSTVNMEAVKSIGNNAFNNSGLSLSTLNLPNVTYIGSSAFYGAVLYGLSVLSLPNVTYIGAAAFFIVDISSVYLLGSSVPTLMSSNAFNCAWTKFYVRSSLLTSFQTASVWSTFSSSRFIGLTDDEILALEG